MQQNQPAQPEAGILIICFKSRIFEILGIKILFKLRAVAKANHRSGLKQLLFKHGCLVKNPFKHGCLVKNLGV